ncbi:lipase family protein [Terrimonas pollutisoli]|uniref:lipase family protein n=1 Tax=Terrimonas pollutisoli TaxID=3034147 RepID=UPI0023ECA49C|nr:lipase family protein [Terrimonas sp. H1YJ31]
MRRLIVLLFLATINTAGAQHKLQPGFDGKEYLELLSLTFHRSSIADSVARKTAKDRYKMEYRSEEMGLQNRWTFYLRDDNVAVIDLRGTVNHLPSWMANFYAAMIPATGTLQLNDSTKFDYQLANDPRAMVHAGWTIAIGHLAPQIIKKINEYYNIKGVKEFYVAGHSQGGALAFLLRSYLHYQQQKKDIPADIFFKTYCSAAPKPGNMYYVYDFDFITRNGWAFNVVNAADWVPETPFSVQTLNDFNPTNPFVNTKSILKKQKLLIRVAGNMVYNKLERKPRKAQKKMEKYLGKVVYKRGVKKILPQLQEPAYAHGNNYMRAGTPVVLMPDEPYKAKFPDNKQTPFVHHSFAAYYFLASKYYP